MLQVRILKGLPASGKSTEAKRLVNSKNRNWIRVEKDCLRAMFHDSHWSKNNEKFITDMRDQMILEGLRAGKHVVVSDTNLAPCHETRIRQIVREEFGSRVQVSVDSSFLDVSLEECIKRDLQRPVSVGEKVIKRMYNQFIKTEPKTIERDPLKEDIILCDLDGTVCLMNGRSPYEWDRVGEDLPNWPVVNTIQRWMKTHKVVFMSGREGTLECYRQSVDWLNRHNLTNGPVDLFMRKEGDCRKDNIIKEELFRKHIEPNYNVITVFDDRDQVVQMWRSIGLTCFQVSPGNF